MQFELNNTTTHDLKAYEDIFKNILVRVFDVLKLSNNYILSATIVDKETIHNLNRDYRNVDRPTDVISFAFLDDKNEKVKSNDMPIDMGEIYICYDVAKENAQKYGNTIKRELCFLFVHGCLHLLGYDHMKKEDEEVMFALQDEILPPNKEIL